MGGVGPALPNTQPDQAPSAQQGIQQQGAPVPEVTAALRATLAQLRAHPDAGPFKDPVSEANAPSYFFIIKVLSQG